MTTLCGGGTSGPKAGVSETIIFTAGSLSSLLNNKGGYWATLAAPLLGVLAYSATNLCSTDPPAQPTITDEEYAALLQLSPWDTLQSALGKLTDIVARLVWFDMCECTSVATPPLPSGTLTPPADVTVPNYGAGTGCPQPRVRLTIPETVPSSSPVPRWANITAKVFPGIPLVQSTASGTYAAADAIVWPSNWGTGKIRATLVAGNPGASTAYTVYLGGHGSSGTFDNTLGQVQLSAATPSASNTFPVAGSSWRYLSVWQASFASAVTDGTVDLEIDIACTTGSTASECCSDPASLAMLGQIMQQVNLIQRQSVPFAYVSGAAHTGLTGTGTISVQGLLGALVEITDGLSNIGVEDGTPDETFEAGWITWGNADGYSARERITHEALLSLPAMAGQYTTIGYTLTVGVEISITELVREP